MKKLLLILLSVSVCVLVITACGKKEEVPEETLANDAAIYGTWMEDYWDSGYTFREDGTGEDIYWSQDFTYTALDGTLEIQYAEGLWAEKIFTYTIEGNVLKLTEVIEPAADGTETEEPGTWDYTKIE